MEHGINNYAEGYERHQFEVFWNGVLIKTAVHTKADTLIGEADAAAFNPVAGANVMETRRAPAPASSTDGWVQFDVLSLEIDPIALQDVDGDGAGDAWELPTGYLANSATSAPPGQNGDIGIHFVMELESPAMR